MEGGRLNHLRGYLETRQWDQAWDEFQRLQGEGPSTPQLLLMGSHAAFGQRDLVRARHLVEKALSLWTQSDSVKLLGQIRFHLGVVAHDLGDSHVAQEQIGLFLSDLTKYPELSMGEGKAYLYQALTLRQRRDLDGAVVAYHKAITCFERDQLPSFLCLAYQNLAWLFCHMKRADEARDSLEKATGLLKTSADHIHQTLGEAFLATVEGKYGVATELCQAVFRRVERGESVTEGEQAQAAWIAGMAALDLGNLDCAMSLADVSLNYATSAKEARLINDASSLRREILLRTRAGA